MIRSLFLVEYVLLFREGRGGGGMMMACNFEKSIYQCYRLLEILLKKYVF